MIIQVFWDDDYEQYVATCEQFPRLCGRADTQARAVADLFRRIEARA